MAQFTSHVLSMLLAEGHPMQLREAAKAFECAGLASEAAQVRARLPEVTSAWLAARMAEGDYTRLAEAVLAAEAEGISCADARAQLQRLVDRTEPFFNPFLLKMATFPF